MRAYNTMMNLILSFAEREGRVRAVMLNGSRVNDNAPVDMMQDYDVVFFVKDVKDAYYKLQRDWIEQFGEIVIMQQNDFEKDGYIFLMQFIDGVRIDLCFVDVEDIDEKIREDSLSRIIMDKDALVSGDIEANDAMHWVQRPSEQRWNNVLNNIWWIQTYVAKGIWRDELPYAKYMYDVVLMDGIRELVSWYIGMENDWTVNTGKCGKWFKRLLSAELYEKFKALYAGENYDELWQKMTDAGDFVGYIGRELSAHLDYRYPEEEHRNVVEFNDRIKGLPKDATTM